MEVNRWTRVGIKHKGEHEKENEHIAGRNIGEAKTSIDTDL